MSNKRTDMENPTHSNPITETTSQKFLWWFASIAILVVIFCIGYGIVMSGNENRGTFGDMFGAVGALFSGLAFAGVIVTMMQQSETLKLQREDLRNQTEAIMLQRQEIANTNKELQEQNKTIVLQRFENTFFSMLEIQQEILNNITVFKEITHISKSGKEEEKRINRDELHGRPAMSILWKNYCIAIRIDKEIGNPIQYFVKYLSDKQYTVPYFRQVFQIITFVDRSNILTLEEKNSYICIIRDTLSSDEISLIFYYVISKNDYQRYKQLIEKYALFEHIGDSMLVSPNHRSLYDDGAYKSMTN